MNDNGSKASSSKGIAARVDYPGYLSRHDIVYRTPPIAGFEGFPLGNGDLAAVVWTHETGLTVQISKNDAWDTPRGDAPTLLRSLGRLTLDFSTPLFQWLYLDDFEGRLRLSDGVAAWQTQTPFIKVKASTQVLADRNVLLIDCEAEALGDLAPEGAPIRIGLERWGSRAFGGWYGGIARGAAKGLGEATVAVIDEDILLEEKLGTASFVLAARVIGPVRKAPRKAHARRGEIEVAPATTLRFQIAVAVLSTLDAEQPRDAARALLDRCEAEGTESLRRCHADWWKAFWGKSFVSIGDDYLENLYYLHLYLMAAGSRGRYPLVFNGGAFLWNHDVRQWVTPHHWNMQQSYWSVGPANHPELLEPWITTYWRLKPFAEQHAASRGWPGAILWSEAHSMTGEMSFWDRGDMLNNFTPASQIGEFFHRYWRFTGDDEFLRNRAYPFMKQAAEFYVQALEWDEERKEFFLFPSQPYECPTGNHYRSPITDLAVIRTSFTRLIDMSLRLDVDAEKRREWQRILDGLPPYPTMPGPDGQPVFAVVQNREGGVLAEQQPNPNGFCRNLAPVFPSGDIGLEDSSDELFAIARRTAKMHPPYDLAIQPIAVICARLGRADDAADHLRRSVRMLQHFPNGLFYNISHWHYLSRYKDDVETPEIRCQRDYVYDRLARYPGIGAGDERIDAPTEPFVQHGHETLAILAAAINEMLLQSHEKAIRVFPATPDDWPAAFELLAQGPFLVSSRKEAGQAPEFIIVESLRGGVCRVVNAWPGAGVAMERVAENGALGEARRFGDDGVLEFETKAGEAWVLRPASQAGAPLPARRFSGAPNQSPKLLKEAVLGKPRDF